MYVRTCVLSFPAGKVDIYHFCLYPAITRPLDERSTTYVLNGQLELLLFTSSEDSLSKTHHVEHSAPKVVVVSNRVGWEK